MKSVHENADLQITEIAPDWLKNATASSAERYECKRSPGTPAHEYLVDDGERVKFGNALSHTAIAQTYKARNRSTDEISVITEFNDTRKGALDGQCEIFARLVHPTILRTIGIVIPVFGRPAKVITGFMPHGSSEAVVWDEQRREAMSAVAKVKIIIEIIPKERLELAQQNSSK